MKKFRKVIATGLATMIALSVMSVGVFAQNTTEDVLCAKGLTIVDGMIDYSIYDSDMVYVQEHADMVAEYNAVLKARSSIYSQWNWSNGIYSRTVGSKIGVTIGYYFVPTTTSMYFNAEVVGENTDPLMTVNILNDDDSFTYVGSYYISSTGSDTYAWNNYKRSLNAGQKYVFGFYASENWEYANFDIYKSAM